MRVTRCNVLVVLALAALNSLKLVSEPLADWGASISRCCLVVALAAVGIKTSFRELADLGWAPEILVIAEALFIAVAALSGVSAKWGRSENVLQP